MSSFYDEEKINEWEKFMKGENTRPDGQGTPQPQAAAPLIGGTRSGGKITPQPQAGQIVK